MKLKRKESDTFNLYRNFKWVTLVFIVFLTHILLFSFPHYWHFVLGPVHIPDVYPFLDMKGRLAHIQGYMTGLDIYHVPNLLDPLGRINDKPSYTLLLGHLGLNLEHAVPLSIFFIFLMVFGTLLLIKPRNWYHVIAAYLVICSPSVLFAVERGNDDIVIFVFLLIVPLFLSKNTSWGNLVAFCLISIVGPAKYYPFAAYILFAHPQRTNRQTFFWLTSSITYITVFILLTYKEILFLSSRIPQPNYINSFGAKLLFELLGLKFPIPELLTFISIVIILLFLPVFSLHKHRILPNITKIEEYYFLLGSVILIFCFFVNSNSDYRLVFCLFLLPALFSWLSNTKINFYLRLVTTASIILIIVIMWLPYVYFFFNSVVFDLAFLMLEIFKFRLILTWFLILMITLLSSLLLRPLPLFIKYLQK